MLPSKMSLKRWLAEGGPRLAARKTIAKKVVDFFSKRMRCEGPDVVAWLEG
jgi:hypothetical protein